ncbi:ArsR/SmtB family transcription factor [Nocardia xishanensis]
MQLGDNLTFEALADPTRREILACLARGEMTVGELTSQITHVSRTAISNHLRILRTAGLVTERRAGTYRHYSIKPAPVSDAVGFLSQLYSSTLDGLTEATAEEASAAHDRFDRGSA